jgi:hypothetical protein
LTWIIIGLVLIIAFGPIAWMIPSAKDRRLAQMRSRARALGLHIEMTQIEDHAAGPTSRVTAGGVRLEPKIDCAVYRLPIRRTARAAPQWQIRREADADDGPLPGWRWESARAGDREYWAEVAPVVAELPPDTLALAADASEVGCWWRERAGAEDAVACVDRLHGSLQKLAEIQIVMDTQSVSSEISDEPPET